MRRDHAETPAGAHRVTTLRLVGLLLTFALLAGCHGPRLPQAPNLYVHGEDIALREVSPDVRTPAVEILYATDRVPVEPEEAGELLSYSKDRSHSLAFGRAAIQLGKDRELPWQQLVEASMSQSGKRLSLEIVEVEELVRFPSSVEPLIEIDGELKEDPEVTARTQAIERRVIEQVSARLAESERKEIFLYVHGVANRFEDPLHRMTQLWHYLGRIGVPVIYTWPAGGGGILRGYTYDRESSEFTIYHFRHFLRTIARCPELERLHIIAHSRGTDVTMTTLRDIQLQCLAAGEDAREVLHLGNVILAAPDIDFGVAQQRLIPDRVARVPTRMTFYVSEDDRAIGIADWLFSSIRRLGQLTSDLLTSAQRTSLEAGSRIGAMDFIDTRAKSNLIGHSYFIDNPAVLSDLILILRDDRSAGAEHGRPLIKKGGGFWELHDGYPYSGVHAAEISSEESGQTAAQDQ